MKAAGKLRYVGITTSHGRRHDELEKIMASQKIDFVQLSYNAVDREVEQRLLPLAQERKIAVICNRPFQQGDLIQAIQRAPLPSWSAHNFTVRSALPEATVCASGLKATVRTDDVCPLRV